MAVVYLNAVLFVQTPETCMRKNDHRFHGLRVRIRHNSSVHPMRDLTAAMQTYRRRADGKSVMRRAIGFIRENHWQVV
ncbi:hypothetical protein, partial [Paraburkholderia sediminicola]|uniref:hypothetical protein n=1 Tax=Paraburkholderia sediminicola TaxID=458836 RepID=UPI0038B891AD